MKKVIKAGLMALLVFVVGACDEKELDKSIDKAATKLAEAKCVDNSPAKTTTFKDPRDGKTYKSVKIGNQTWMAQNLDFHGEDGFLGLCYGDKPKEKISNPGNCKKYGRLYDWKEAMKACPKGWHLPSDKEWQTLVDFVGGEEVASKKLSSQCGWGNCGPTKLDERGRTIEGNCTNEFGFSALPGGSGAWGNFNSVGDRGFWWSSREYNATNACYRNAYSYGEKEGDKEGLLSVRCIEGGINTTTNTTKSKEEEVMKRIMDSMEAAARPTKFKEEEESRRIMDSMEAASGAARRK